MSDLCWHVLSAHCTCNALVFSRKLETFLGRAFARQLLSKIRRNIFPQKHYTEPHLIETMVFSQRLSFCMFLSQSHLHEPFICNACIFPPLLQNLYDVLFLSRKKVLVVSLRGVNLRFWSCLGY